MLVLLETDRLIIKIPTATKLACGLRDWGLRNLADSKLVAVVDPRNVNSQHVIAKTGLEFVKFHRIYNKPIIFYRLPNNETFFQAVQRMQSPTAVFAAPQAKL